MKKLREMISRSFLCLGIYLYLGKVYNCKKSKCAFPAKILALVNTTIQQISIGTNKKAPNIDVRSLLC